MNFTALSFLRFIHGPFIIAGGNVSSIICYQEYIDIWQI